MTQYIDKQKIAEQIERARKACSEVACNPNEDLNDYYLGKVNAYREMQDFLETLETKEVDLAKEIDLFIDSKEAWEIQEAPISTIENATKHFFELGTQTNNVWHSYNEPMDTNKTMLILSPNGKSSLALWNGKSLSTTTIEGGHNILCNGDKWTYVEDLAQKGE